MRKDNKKNVMEKNNAQKQSGTKGTKGTKSTFGRTNNNSSI